MPTERNQAPSSNETPATGMLKRTLPTAMLFGVLAIAAAAFVLGSCGGAPTGPSTGLDGATLDGAGDGTGPEGDGSDGDGSGTDQPIDEEEDDPEELDPGEELHPPVT